MPVSLALAGLAVCSGSVCSQQLQGSRSGFEHNTLSWRNAAACWAPCLAVSRLPIRKGDASFGLLPRRDKERGIAKPCAANSCESHLSNTASHTCQQPPRHTRARSHISICPQLAPDLNPVEAGKGRRAILLCFVGGRCLLTGMLARGKGTQLANGPPRCARRPDGRFGRGGTSRGLEGRSGNA